MEGFCVRRGKKEKRERSSLETYRWTECVCISVCVAKDEWRVVIKHIFSIFGFKERGGREECVRLSD
jgi:O-phosphoseryl-tRNA(Cys) synthetase